jgi:hypothetical protein
VLLRCFYVTHVARGRRRGVSLLRAPSARHTSHCDLCCRSLPRPVPCRRSRRRIVVPHWWLLRLLLAMPLQEKKLAMMNRPDKECTFSPKLVAKPSKSTIVSGGGAGATDGKKGKASR